MSDDDVQTAQTPLLKTQRKSDFYDSIVRETNDDLANINKQIGDLHEAMSMVKQMVGEQGEKLEIVEENVKDADVAVEVGVQDIVESGNQQRNARLKILCIVVTVIVLIVVLILVLLGPVFHVYK